MSDDLFPNGFSSPARTDETIYSWVARLYRLHGGLGRREFSRLLFGDSAAGLRCDFPSRLGYLSRLAGGDVGDADAALIKRTIYGIHAPFLSVEADAKIREGFIGRGSSGALRALGIPRSGWSRINSLKFCSLCASDQQTHAGTAWWLTSQQLPSSFVCEAHGVWLFEQVTSRHRGVTDDFYLPNVLGARPCASAPRGAQAYRSIEKLGTWGRYFRGQRANSFTDTPLRYAYLLAAKARGLTALDGSLRMHAVRDAFVEHFDGSLELFGEDFLGDILGTSCGFLPLLVRRFPGHRHPVKHLLMMSFLFETLDEFTETFDQAATLWREGGEAAVFAELSDGKSALLNMVAAGKSVSEAAARMGIPVSQATRTLDNLGAVDRPRRPRIIGTVREVELRRLLVEGRSRAEIAQAVNVRRAFIKDYLSSRPELKLQWEAAHFLRQREVHRARLSEMLKEHSDLSIKAIRRLPGNVFQWLYNHDRDWLCEVLPAIWRR